MFFYCKMSNITTFESKQEFNDYYKEHKEEIDELKTKELNDKFKVEGFKIIRNKGKITFRRIKEAKQKENDNSHQELKIDDVMKQLKEMNDKLNEIFDKLDEMKDQE